MKSMYRIYIDAIPPTLNKYMGGGSWHKKAEAKTEWLGLFQYAFIEAGLPKKLKTPLSMSVTQFCKGRVRDADNAVISAKFCSDSLVKLGYIEDDKDVKPVTLNTEKGKINKTVILIYEYDRR